MRAATARRVRASCGRLRLDTGARVAEVMNAAVNSFDCVAEIFMAFFWWACDKFAGSPRSGE